MILRGFLLFFVRAGGRFVGAVARRDGRVARATRFISEFGYNGTREPSDQINRWAVIFRPRGFVVMAHHLERSLAGFRKTGLLAANAFCATCSGAMEYFWEFFYFSP